MNVHLNPKYVIRAINGGHRFNSAIILRYENKGETYGFLTYDIRTDEITYLDTAGFVWVGGRQPDGATPAKEFISQTALRDLGWHMTDERWFLRNEEPSPFDFRREK